MAAADAFSVTGEADRPPVIPGPTTGDAGTGVQLAMAILAAYVQRLRTGEGQQIEISMQEAMTWYMRRRVAIASWTRQFTKQEVMETSRRRRRALLAVSRHRRVAHGPASRRA